MVQVAQADGPPEEGGGDGDAPAARSIEVRPFDVEGTRWWGVFVDGGLAAASRNENDARQRAQSLRASESEADASADNTASPTAQADETTKGAAGLGVILSEDAADPAEADAASFLRLLDLSKDQLLEAYRDALQKAKQDGPTLIEIGGFQITEVTTYLLALAMKSDSIEEVGARSVFRRLRSEAGLDSKQAGALNRFANGFADGSVSFAGQTREAQLQAFESMLQSLDERRARGRQASREAGEAATTLMTGGAVRPIRWLARRLRALPQLEDGAPPTEASGTPPVPVPEVPSELIDPDGASDDTVRDLSDSGVEDQAGETGPRKVDPEDVVIEDIRGWDDLTITDAQTENEEFVAKYTSRPDYDPSRPPHPPHHPDHPVYIGTYRPGHPKLVQVLVDGNANYSSWFLTKADFDRMMKLPNPRKALKDHLALPRTPTWVVPFNPPKGARIRMRVSVVNLKEGWGRGGGIQYQAVNRADPNWFDRKNGASIPGGE